jgi:hypothetical protein
MLCISCNDFGIDKEAFSTPLNVISLDFCNWKSQTWTKIQRQIITCIRIDLSWTSTP